MFDFRKVILGITFPILGLLTIMTFISYYFIDVATDGRQYYYTNIFLLVGILLFSLFLALLKSILEQINSSYLFLGIAVIYLLIGLHFIFHITDSLKVDTLWVYQFAQSMKAGNYADLLTPGGYLHYYPHQLGMAFLDRFYLLFHHSARVGYVFNLIYVIGINACQAFLVQEFFKKSLVTNYTIILSFLFLPHFFFILFLYGTLPGLFFALVGFSAFVRYQKKAKKRYLMLSLLSLSVAVLIRNNYMIFILAMLVVLLFDYLKKKQIRKGLLFSAIVFLSLWLGQQGLNTYVKLESGATNLPTGIPKIAYVVMGLQEVPGYPDKAGQFNFYTSGVFGSQNFDPLQTKVQASEDLKARLDELMSHPSYALDFFQRKLRNTWTDPTFFSVISGNVEAVDPNDTGFWAKLYRGEGPYITMQQFSYIWLCLIYLLSFISIVLMLFKVTELKRYTLFYPLVFLGGFSFHLIWETKSQYSHYYVYFLIPLAAYGLVYLLEAKVVKDFLKLPQRKRLSISIED